MRLIVLRPSRPPSAYGAISLLPLVCHARPARWSLLTI